MKPQYIPLRNTQEHISERKFPCIFFTFCILFFLMFIALAGIGFIGWQMYQNQEDRKETVHHCFEEELAKLNKTLLVIIDTSLATLNLTVENRLKKLDNLLEAQITDAKTLILTKIDRTYQTKLEANQSLSTFENKTQKLLNDKITNLDHSIEFKIENLSKIFISELSDTKTIILTKMANEYLSKTEGTQRMTDLESRIQAQYVSKPAYEQSIGLLDHEHPDVYDRLDRHRFCRLLASSSWMAGKAWSDEGFDHPLWGFWRCDEFYYYDDNVFKVRGRW